MCAHFNYMGENHKEIKCVHVNWKGDNSEVQYMYSYA